MTSGDVYPRLLIINYHAFNDGSGVMLKNLFHGWPVDRIAVAHCDNSPPHPAMCERYYRLGLEENHYIFPLNKISREKPAKREGPYQVSHNDREEVQGKIPDQVRESKQFSPGRDRLFRIIRDFGVNDFLHPMHASQRFLRWIDEFHPDILYTQLAGLGIFTIVEDVLEHTKCKLAIHVMDDWPSTLYADRYLRFFLRWKIDRKFRKLLRYASLRLGISSSMADEYAGRYGLPFQYAHNPIRSEAFAWEDRLAGKSAPPYTIAYAGRIGWATFSSVIDVCEVIRDLRAKGFPVEFHAHVATGLDDSVRAALSMDGVKILPPLNDANFVQKLREADLLLYPVDFDDESFRGIRLSMPTKIPAYLASGVPILCYGPIGVYGVDLLSKSGLGVCVTERNRQKLGETIARTLEDLDGRRDLGRKGHEFAVREFDQKTMRQKFHQSLIRAAQAT